MVLVNKDMEKEMTRLVDKLIEFVADETTLCIHGRLKGLTVRNTVVIDNFVVTKEGVCLECGKFYFDVQSPVKEVKYIEEGSVNIKFVDGELYLDVI